MYVHPYNKLVGSDQLSQLCTGFIKFIEEILLPIQKQDTKQFHYWSKFKEIIDPLNHTIEISKIAIFLQQIQNTKSNLENQIPTSILSQEQPKNTLNIQDKRPSIPQTNVNQIKSQEFNTKLIEITERINKSFHQNNTHLEILLKMNNDNNTQDANLKLDNNNQRNATLTRRMDFKRRNTDYYSLKPINI